MPKKKGKFPLFRVRLAFHSPRTANPEKRGAKGHFSGSRLDFLNGYCDQYNSLRGKNRARFWLNFFDEWWKTYPWRLADNEEPPNDDAKMQALSEVGTEKALKKDVETKLKVVSLLHFWVACLDTDSRHHFRRGSARGSPIAPLSITPATRAVSGTKSSNAFNSKPTPNPVVVPSSSSSHTRTPRKLTLPSPKPTKGRS